MGYIVRFVRRSNFLCSKAWTDESVVPGDALRHFRDGNQELSLYRIESLAELPRLVAALALADAEGLKTRDALYIDEAPIIEEFNLRQTPGELPDTDVNTWHWQCDGMTEHQVQRMTLLFGVQGEMRRFSVADVARFACEAHDTGRIDFTALSAGVSRDLERALARRQP